MDKKMLQKTFREYKKASGVRYSITNPTSLGDCSSCVGYALCKKYGEDSKGVWVKHWVSGMNGDYPLDFKKSDGTDMVNCVYVAHDLGDEQVDAFYKVVGENYNILPKREDFSPYKCFCLYEKDVDVWTVNYRDTDYEHSNEFVGKEEAVKRVKNLLDCGIEYVQLYKTF